jgi:hypothetical protein
MWGNTAGEAGVTIESIKTFGDVEDVNWVKNGGFEWLSDGLPVAWGTGRWGIGASPWMMDYDTFVGTYAIDEKEAKEGIRCLRLTNVGNAPFAYSCWMSPPSDWRYRLSLEMKASTPMHVSIEYSGIKKDFEITSIWNEYAIDDLAPSSRSRIGIFSLGKGVLWVDSVSLMTEGKTRKHGYSAPHPDDGPSYLPSTSSIPDRLSEEQVLASSVKATVKPIMSLGFESVPSKAIVEKTAELGFGYITVFLRSSVKPEDVGELLDNAGNVGISVIVWLDKKMDLSIIQSIVRAYGNYKSLTAWYVWDEPKSSERPAIEARIKAIRSLDPNHPILVNDSAYSQNSSHQGDIVSTDIYPIPDSSPGALIGPELALSSFAQKISEPFWIWLQGCGFAYNITREPSPAEYRNMVLTALIDGVSGIQVFSNMPESFSLIERFRKVNEEIRLVGPILISRGDFIKVESKSNNIVAKKYSLDDLIAIAISNPTPEKQDFNFPLPRGYAYQDGDDAFSNSSAAVYKSSVGPYDVKIIRLKRK